jgi:hypothetical protein
VANRRIRILADDQRCARVVNEQQAQPPVNPRALDRLLNLA